MHKVLIASPIREKKEILTYYLDSLIKNAEVCDEICQCGFYFIDDNLDEESSEILREYKCRYEKSFKEFEIEKITFETDGEADREECWNSNKIMKMTKLRDHIVEHLLNENYDYLLMVDSDLILSENALSELLEAKKDIVSPVHWTNINNGYHPNVWLYDFWDFAYRNYVGEYLSKAENLKRMTQFFKKIKLKGLIKVGGACGCTLTRAECFRNGLKYAYFGNTSVLSEDYYFCTRASVLGYEIYADSEVDSFHIFDDAKLEEYRKLQRERDAS